MEVKMVDCTLEPESKIARYAAICYDADTSDEANDRRVKKLMNLGHLATLRFAYATFKVSGVSRACSHQLVRHPHLSYLQRSQRYVNEKHANLVLPESLLKAIHQHTDGHSDRFLDEYDEYISYVYNTMIANGASKGDARYLLPQAVETELYVTGNFQAWHDFLKNRTAKSAQWEIRTVANSAAQQLHKIAPNVFWEFV